MRSLLGLITGSQGVKIPSNLHSINETLHLLNEAVFIDKPVFWLSYGLGLQRKFRKNGQYIKAIQGRKCCSAERLVELYFLNQQWYVKESRTSMFQYKTLLAELNQDTW